MWWQRRGKNDHRMFSPLGVLATGETVGIDWAAPQNIALQGMTRSGKSAATYAFLSTLVPHKECVKLVVLDPTGVLGAPVKSSEFTGTVSLGDDPRSALDSVVEVLDIVKQRCADLVDSGQDKRTEWTAEVPLVLLVLEELPGIVDMLQDDDAVHGRKASERLAPRFLSTIRQICAQGLKAGVVVLALAQRFDAAIITGAARANFGVRCSLRVDDSDSVRMLFPSADSAVGTRLATVQPGRGFITAPGVDLQPVRMNHLSYEQYLENLGGMGVSPISRRGLGR